MEAEVEVVHSPHPRGGGGALSDPRAPGVVPCGRGACKGDVERDASVARTGEGAAGEGDEGEDDEGEGDECRPMLSSGMGGLRNSLA